MHPRAEKVVAVAAREGIALTVTEFPAGTRTAEEAAAAIGCVVGQIVKSLLFVVAGAPVMTLVSGASRLDEEKLARLRGVGRKRVRRADATRVRETTGYAIGGVPPFAHARPIPVLADRDLMGHDVVWAAAGTPNTVFSIAPAELVRLAGAEVADIAVSGRAVPGRAAAG